MTIFVSFSAVITSLTIIFRSESDENLIDSYYLSFSQPFLKQLLVCVELATSMIWYNMGRLIGLLLFTQLVYGMCLVNLSTEIDAWIDACG